MKQIRQCKIIGLVILFFSVFICVPTALASPQVATVKGTAADVEQALQDAKYKAVYKSLTHLIRLENTTPEQLKSLMENYAQYVLQQKILQKKSQDNEICVIARITVDADKLQHDVEQLIFSRHQERIFAMPACFLVRVLGAENPDEADGIVLTACSSHYQNLGFETETNYHYAIQRRPGIARMDSDSYETYCCWAEQKLYHEWQEYSFALLGEVVLETRQQDFAGVTKRAQVRVKALDVKKQKYIGTFMESYEFRGATADEAERQVLNKAAMDFAEVLGGQTLHYWEAEG